MSLFKANYLKALYLSKPEVRVMSAGQNGRSQRDICSAPVSLRRVS
jgi:hypothetical protein